MRPGKRALALCVTFIVVATTASATVTQVDGTILPVSNPLNSGCDGANADSLQACFNLFEGVSPPNANAITEISDASEFPQVFLPSLTTPVVFRDIAEGAGFENSFGWYNVGDDVVTATGREQNLHPVFGCGIPMAATGNATTHQGNPAHYIQNANPNGSSTTPTQVSVDFQAELTANRYKGGLIGFYLITPEDPANRGNRLGGGRINCGDFKNDPNNGLPLFGFIYFTQKDLNNDGDFVHHLVYRSRLNPERFYFGFEDLFRGGDNDFEDMLLLVTGLTPPCVPQPEVCDGIDNDCDGIIDAADPDLTGVGTACNCDGLGMTCDNGPLYGQCQSGVTRCTAGAITCHGTGTPSPETCDGKDQNCNNIVDDNPSGTGAACDGPDADLCPEGTIVCQNGALACSDTTGPNQELCNNADDDCDGSTDEGNPGGGGSCGSSIGECTPGTYACQGGTLVCVGATGGMPEVCNGLDDDCNGVADNSPTDVGQQCGTTNVGQCDYGSTICVGGSLQCAGEIGPTPEKCNMLDDDCNGVPDNNPVDAGQPCGSSIGACMPGTYICMMGTLVCTGGVGPTTEICNGIDDDCNGIVDDNVPGEGQACGIGMCMDGMTKCIAGSLQCVGGATTGTEVCNGMDDDCDNKVDEGPLCGGGVCDNGTCAAPCVESEFPCPAGKKCDENKFCVDDPCYSVTCPIDMAGNLQTCVEGVCEPVCNTQTCPSGLVCRGSDGACVPDRCEYLPKCNPNELCVDGACVPDPCQGVTCASNEFCRAGACVVACGSIECPQGKQCRDGVCEATGCAVTCGEDMVCNPDTGMCINSRCDGVQCPTAQVCDPLTGACIADACQGVTCPDRQTCSFGQCRTPAQGLHVTVGGGGCDASGGDPSLLVGLVALALLVRRRRIVLPCLLAAAASLGAGCNVNDYCIGCQLVDDGGIGSGGDSGGSGSGSDSGTTCDPLQIHPEMCNKADDDCDGIIDETFDLQIDRNNCGACGNKCEKAGAQTTCTAGACAITGCFPGFFDKNGDITGPYATSDGCEYQCFPTNNGVEACDGVDNDCDGNTDETFNLSTDINNCGQCNKVCQFFKATPSCSNGTCSFDPATDCATGYLDIDGNQVNGCEYQCTPSGAEVCDLRDNNCNGSVDETFDLTNDVNNCGGCGFTCQFPHATPHCTLMTCTFNPAVDCQAGYVDVDGKQLNGCEYQCTPTNGGVEICDAIDNDCDGVADDMPVDAGAACSATVPPTGACVANGTLTCSNGSLVCTNATMPIVETCNNIDDDCDGTKDNGVTQSCYTGAMGTSGVGLCKNGTASCANGAFGACMGQVTPVAEQCNNLDDNCNGMIDDGPGGTAITQSCYTGPMGTSGVGLCKSGTATCAFGAFGSCIGQVTPTADICGDNLDSDCDGQSDTQEGCLALDTEQRLDAGATMDPLGTNAAARHDYDIVLARGGDPLGSRVYAAWSHLEGSVTEVYFRRSLDGGVTWGSIINITSAVSATAVKPVIAVSPGATDRVVVAYQTVASGVRDIIVSVSADSGATFGTASAALDAAGDSFHHAVAVRGTTVVVAWEKLDTSTLDRDIQSRASSDGGATWGTERRINVGSTGARFAGRPQVALTSAGAAIWAWREKRSGATRDIFAAVSADPNVAPAADIRVDGDTTQTRDADFPQLVVEGTAAYLVWQDVSTQANGGSDVMFARSTNGGTAWGAERIIDDPVSEVSSSFTPVLAVDPKTAGATDDLVAIAWEDRRSGTQIYTSTSLDGGATFAAPVRASNNTGAAITGTTSAPQIASAGSGVIVVTYQNKQGQSPSHVYTSSSIDSGATWVYTHARLDGGAGSAITPQVVGSIVAAKPAAVAGWADFRGNGVNGDVYIAVAHR